MTGGHNTVEYCSGSYRKESSLPVQRSPLVLALSLGRGLRCIVPRVRGVLGHLPHTAALRLAVSSHCCSGPNCMLGMFT